MSIPPGADKAHFVRGMFDAISGRYDLMNRLMTGWQDERWRAMAADAIHPETAGIVLDVGAGTGDLSFAVARRAPGARVVAADFSSGMLTLAQEKKQHVSAGRHVEPVLADAMRLPVQSASVDAVVTGFTMRNVADLRASLAEFARVLRPGGRLAILELTPVTHSPIPGFGKLFDLYFSGVVPIVGSLVSGRGFAYRYLPNSVKIFPDATRLAEMLRDVGFSEVQVKRLALGTLALHTATLGAPAAATVSGVSMAAPASAGASVGAGAPMDAAMREVHAAAEWNELLARVPNGHILQSWEWGELKRETGWVPRRFVFERGDAPVAAASVARRALPRAPLGIAYCQKGPALDYEDRDLFRTMLDALAAHARAERCIFLKIDPDVESTQRAAATVLRESGFVPAAEQVQTRSTVFVDLRGTEKEVLGRMSSTWRRYINKAGRDGVTLREATVDDLPRFFDLMRETGARDHFFVRPYEYYRSAFLQMIGAGLATLFLAEVEGVPEAAVFACSLGKRAWYLYGASSKKAQEQRAPYLIQWHTMQWARARGCESYDMWGAPDDPADKDDPLSGVYYFKRGFGGRHVRMVGVFDYVVSPALYALWERALPRYIGLLRRFRGERAGAAGGGHA